jgi:hypothetical protein
MIVTGGAEMAPDLTPEALRQLRLRRRQAVMVADQYFEPGFPR